MSDLTLVPLHACAKNGGFLSQADGVGSTITFGTRNARLSADMHHLTSREIMGNLV